MKDLPFIPPESHIAELTLRCVLLAIALTILLATANAYLALKLGILTSASIPAAIISMGILRFFKNPSILENNLVQTAASAGEAVAGGIVYTIPALIVIQYWHGFDYWSNFLIAVIGGALGVLFSIPLRRLLVHDPLLRFPEGRAIAEVLKTSAAGQEVKNIFLGGGIGALLELLQSGVKLLASNWNVWFSAKKTLFGFGMGFSGAMIGAGYLIGPGMALSILCGAVISWLIAMPIASYIYPQFLHSDQAAAAANLLWDNKMRYLGIGAMLFAGIWTLIKLIKPLSRNISDSLNGFFKLSKQARLTSRVETDIPFPILIIGVLLAAIVLFYLFHHLLPLRALGFSGLYANMVMLAAVVYVLVIGFLFSIITAYFSGMVGVTASPGSSIVIAGLLFAAWLLLSLVNHVLPLPLSADQIKAIEAIAIIIGGVVTGIAAIANDNTQDLKVGQLLGATPWKQQCMLLLGVAVSSLVIPPVMQLLFNVYGIGDVLPRPGMDLNQALPAPTAALMAAITEAVFQHTMPWEVMLAGAVIIIMILLINRFMAVHLRLSILGVAIGMYLPMSSSFPLFLGGMIALMVQKHVDKAQQTDPPNHNLKTQRGVLIACGLVAGAALMDVLLAIPFSIFRSPDILSLTGAAWQPWGICLSILSTGLLAAWIYKKVAGN